MKKIKIIVAALLLAIMPVLSTELASASTPGPETDTGLTTDCEAGPGEELTRDNCRIIDYLVVAINFLSALAGLAIIGSIMLAGYQYMTARDNSGQIEAARKRIIWALSALGIFIFMYAGLNSLVPGGVL